MAEINPAEVGGMLETLAGIFGPGGAVLAATNVAAMWWLNVMHKDHKDERLALVLQIKDSELLRRQDAISQFDKIEKLVDRIDKSMTTLIVAFERKGIRTNV